MRTRRVSIVLALLAGLLPTVGLLAGGASPAAASEAPHSTLTSPNLPHVAAAGWAGLSGHSTDPDGIPTTVNVALFDDTAAVVVAESQPALTPVDAHTVSWSVPVPVASMTDDHHYTVVMTAFDDSNDAETPNSTFGFTFHTAVTPPTVTVLFPISDLTGADAWTSACPTGTPSIPQGGVCGTTTDGQFGPVTSVHVRVARTSPDQAYWSPLSNAWVSGTTTVLFGASLTGNSWSHPIPRATMVDGATYSITAEVRSADGGFGSTTWAFTYDGAAPNAATINPPTGSAINAADLPDLCFGIGLCGSTSDDLFEDELPAEVEVSLRRGTNLWFTGTGFVSLPGEHWVPADSFSLAEWYLNVPASVFAQAPAATYRARVRTFDHAGNMSAIKETTFLYDDVHPEGTLTFPVDGGVYSPEGFAEEHPAVGCPASSVCGTAADAHSGLTDLIPLNVSIKKLSNGTYWSGTDFVSTPISTQPTIDEDGGWVVPIAALTEGDYDVTLTTADRAGNVGVDEMSFRIDATYPSMAITFPVDGTTYDAATWSAGCADAICGTAADPGGTVAGLELAVQRTSDDFYLQDDGSWAAAHHILHPALVGGVWRVPLPAGSIAEGTIEMLGAVTDAAGNRNFTQLVDFTYDGTGPNVTVELVGGDANEAGWFSSAPTIRTTATDFSTFTCDPDVVYSGPDGANITVQRTCTDALGNVGTGSVTFSIDRVAPTASVSLDRAPDANGWYRAPVTATWTGEDATSPVFCTEPMTHSGPEGADVTLSGSCFDAAGNESVPATATFDYDATGPAITVAAPAGTLTYGQAVIVDYACVDALSGVATCAGTLADGATLDTSSLGPKTFVVSSTDTAGNTSSKTVAYEVVKASPGLVVTIAPSPSTVGQVVPVATATVTGPLGPPTGTVQLAVDGTNVGSPVSLVNGVAQVTLPGLHAGTHTVTATYSGDANHLGKTATASHLVTRAPTVLQATPALLGIRFGPGLGVSLYTTTSATLISNGAPLPGQTIVFRAGSTVLCQAVTNAQGVAQCSSLGPLLGSILGLGYQASFAGDLDRLPATANAPVIGLG